MNVISRIVAGAIVALYVAAAAAHPNHGDGPPVTREELPAIGGQVVGLLVERKQLAPSWQKRPVKEVASRETPAGLVWMVSYENPSEADRAKRVMYMFFDEFGNFIGANYSGKLQ